MRRPITVIGMSAGGATSLSSKQVGKIENADLLVGGRRHLDYFSNFQGETMSITADIAPVIDRLQRALDHEEDVVVLASGDPLCYGIGASLRQYFPAQALCIEPGPAAFQLAFAALAEPWPDAALLSAHARPLSTIIPKGE